MHSPAIEKVQEQKNWIDRLFNTSSLYQSRRPWVDYLKGIAILLVVYRHVIIGIERTGISIPRVLMYANMIFFSFRMPLFFILSGLFISQSLAKRSPSSIIGNRFEKLIYPYVIWAFIQITIQILVANYTGQNAHDSYVNSHRGVNDYLYILYHPQKIDQFWYFPALFNATVVFVFIKTKFSPNAWAHLLFAIFLFFIAPIWNSFSILYDWMHFYAYFVFGDLISTFLMREKTVKLLQKNYVLIALIPLFCLTQVYYVTHVVVGWQLIPVVITGCMMMLIISLRLQQWNAFRFLRVLGYHSLYIYVMHVMASALTRIILTKALGIYNPGILLAVGILAGTLIPILIYNLLLKKYGWFLFSYKRSKPAPHSL